MAARSERSAMMRTRLRQLVTSFNKTAIDYALARLEVAIRNARSPAPPVIARLGASGGGGRSLSTSWPAALAQVGAAADYIAAGNAGAWKIRRDLAWTRLERSVRIAVQLAESIDWIGVDTHGTFEDVR